MSWKSSSPARKSPLLVLLALACCAQTNPAPKEEIRVLSMSVDGKPIKLSAGQPVRLPPFPGSVDIHYGSIQHRGKQSSEPVRSRCRLDNVDTEWREVTTPACVMRLFLGFLDQDGNEVQHVDFIAAGQSAGWTGSFKTSPLRHRREQILVPPNVSSFWVVISSAGGPEAIGAFFVSNLSVKVLDSTNAPARELFKMQFDKPGLDPVGWRRDGLRSSMAKVVRIGGDPAKTGVAVVDDHPGGHAQWNTLKGQGPKVSPHDLLVLEWDEMFSVGMATPATVSYKDLEPGFYRFSLNQLSLMGVPSGAEFSMGFDIMIPFWRTPWFWVSVISLVTAMGFGVWRYREARYLQLENVRLAQQQVLEAERFRIARDIHDDFGARVTQISLLSSAAQQRPGLDAEVMSDFAAVSEMSRSLVGSLYETVWAISPENDHLDSLATYICQMANQMSAQAELKCRLSIPDLPHEVSITSSTRHNLVMTVKEAIHNIIKHAEATEVQVSIQVEGGLMCIEVRDNGKGFDLSTRRRGNGLNNMKRRVTAAGGRWTQTSRPGEGTRIRVELQLSQNGGSPPPHTSQA